MEICEEPKVRTLIYKRKGVILDGEKIIRPMGLESLLFSHILGALIPLLRVNRHLV